ncbi:MAG: hypothetical protein GY839_10400 [candidate division Zixibacteria bacterium]|nr:hypothetical protein [candidate division Zixibacteria bacterium]
MMNEFEQQVQSPYQKFRAFIAKKPVKYSIRIAYAILNLYLIGYLWSTIDNRVATLTGFSLSNLAKYIYQPHTAEVGGREFKLPSGFFVYDEPTDKNNLFLWFAIDINASMLIYKEYYEKENASYSDTCYKWFKRLSIEGSLNQVNNVIAKYRYGDYDVFMSRDYKFGTGKVYLIDYDACIPEKRIYFKYNQWSIFKKDFKYFKKLVEDICLKDTEGEFVFQGYISNDE